MSPAEKSALETYQRCADRCVELSAENKRLREALEPFVKETPHVYLDYYDSAVEKARAALAALPEAKESK